MKERSGRANGITASQPERVLESNSGRFFQANPYAGLLGVDDDPQALQMMDAAPGSAGYAETCRRDAAQAWQQLEQIRFEAVSLDRARPGMDGPAFLDAMRREFRWKDTPVFIWTGQDLGALKYHRLAESAQSAMHKGRRNVSALIGDMMRWFQRPAAFTASGQATLPPETR